MNTASVLGLFAIPNNIAYVAAKHGVMGLSPQFMLELGLRNQRKFDAAVKRYLARHPVDPGSP